jgi:hypothetical protein
MSILINIASEFTGKKAFREADTAIGKLNKTVKGLGLGFAVSAAAATSFAKASINAFIQDEAAASKLSLAVKNLGMEFANPYIANYISDMEKMTKVADDELRPAFQALLQQTGSLSASQSILSTAIEASRGSGYSLAQVSNDLAQAYIGNTKGLKKYYLGLSNASLQAKSFTEIQKIMNDQFTGSSAAYLNTYSGQVGVLSLAWGNFQEKVGGTLLTLASFGDGSEGAKLNLLASTLDTIGSAIELIGKGKETIAGLFNITGKGGLLSGFNPYRTPTSDKETKAENPMDKYAKQLAKIEADRKKQNAAVLKSQKALTVEQKKQALAKKQSALFDLEQIQIIAALKGNLSQEEQTRLKLQLAILQGNDTEADKLSQKLANSIDSTGKLALSLRTLPDANNPFKSWDAFLDSIIAKARLAASIGGGSSARPELPAMNPTVASLVTGSVTGTAGSTSAGDVYITVNGSVLSEQDLVDAVQSGLNYNALAGKRSDIGRIAGMFG